MADRGLTDLVINRIPGLSPRERVNLCKKFDEEGQIAILSKEDVEKIINRPLRRQWLMRDILKQAEKDRQTAGKRLISWVSWTDPAYPPLLREIFDPPAVLFYRGRLPDPEKALAAVVGTRRPSPAAAAEAFAIARGLGQGGISVVSGLALGIDTMAHRGNIAGQGATIAVLGSSADEIYPSGNKPLARLILERGGAILSEYSPGTPPRKWSFPGRNRIISALARGTVIVEAPEKSGALITAQFALDQGRDLWVASTGALGGDVRRAGTVKLAGDGAKILRSVRDIFAEWNIRPPGTEAGENGTGSRNGSGPGSGEALASSLARSLNIDLKEKV
jgi:DNA processing protein